VPLRVLRSRTLVGGKLATLLLGMAAWGMGLTVAEYAHWVLGYSPQQFGAGTMAMTAMTIVGSYAAQLLVSRIGARTVAVPPWSWSARHPCCWRGGRPTATYVGDILPGLLVFGPGLGGGCVAASVAALGCVAEREAGLASATNTAAFQVGGAFGAATVSTVAASRAVGPVESIGRARCRGRRRSER